MPAFHQAKKRACAHSNGPSAAPQVRNRKEHGDAEGRERDSKDQKQDHGEERHFEIAAPTLHRGVDAKGEEDARRSAREEQAGEERDGGENHDGIVPNRALRDECRQERFDHRRNLSVMMIDFAARRQFSV